MSTAELSCSTATFVLPAAHIAGQPVRTPADAPGAPIFDASTGAAIGWQEFATAAHVDAAVRAARDAFAGWRDTPPAERGRILAKIAERVEASRDRLAALQMQVSGKPPFEADADVGDVAATFAYYAKRARTRRCSRPNRSHCRATPSPPSASTILSASRRSSCRGTSRWSRPRGSSRPRSPPAARSC